MRRVARGDDAAMAALIGRWERPVLAFAYRLLACSADDARDLAQEVFLRVWRRRGRWQPSAGFSTWLFTIASNLCRNRRRDLSRRPAMVPVGADGTVDAVQPLRATALDNPHSRAVANQLAGRVRDAVARLPDKQREVVLLRHFGGLSYREIAQSLATTPSAVDSLLVRARRTLAKSLLDPAQETEAGGVER